MNVEIKILFSDDRPSTVRIAKPCDGEVLYLIVTPASAVPSSVAEGLREARRIFALNSWPSTRH